MESKFWISISFETEKGKPIADHFLDLDATRDPKEMLAGLGKGRLPKLVEVNAEKVHYQFSSCNKDFYESAGLLTPVLYHIVGATIRIYKAALAVNKALEERAANEAAGKTPWNYQVLDALREAPGDRTPIFSYSSPCGGRMGDWPLVEEFGTFQRLVRLMKESKDTVLDEPYEFNKSRTNLQELQFAVPRLVEAMPQIITMASVVADQSSNARPTGLTSHAFNHWTSPDIAKRTGLIYESLEEAYKEFC